MTDTMNGTAPVAAKQVLRWEDARRLAAQLADRWRRDRTKQIQCVITSVHGVPRGGSIVAAWVAHELGVPQVGAPEIDHGTLVVDDIVDSGATRDRYAGQWFDALIWREAAAATAHLDHPRLTGLPTSDSWVVFPWEEGTVDETGPGDAVVRILEHIGEDPNREGLADTPARVLKAFTEMTTGYHLDPATILERTFDVGDADELVVVRGIPFHSLCEHHLLSFTGTATVGYLPVDRVVGLSKIPRLVDCYARRLQVQERMTRQIADALVEHLGVETVGVVVRGEHSCMSCRGVGKSAEMITSRLTGMLRDDAAARAEFMGLERG